MAYVSLGRSEQLKDIFIKGKVDPTGIHASPEALEETLRLKSIFDERQKQIVMKKENFWKVSYLNVRSLKCHYEDVAIDNIILTSDLFGLGETWLNEEESRSFLGFKEHNANHGHGKGVSVFSKVDNTNRPVVNQAKSSIFSAIQYRTTTFDAIFLYWSSGCSNEETTEILNLIDSWILNDRPTTILGDVNADFSENCKLNAFLSKRGFQQLIHKSTCDTGSLLDHIYANEPLRQLNISVEQYSTYYSDHDVISIYIPK